MHAVLRRSVVAAGVGAGVIAVRRIAIRQLDNGAAKRDGDRWHTLTINRPPTEVAPEGRPPAPLAELGDAVEVQVRPAPGGRGTEVAARVVGDVPVRRLRTALRQSRQLAETGEVLEPDQPPTSRRTLRNLPLELATRGARGEGRL